MVEILNFCFRDFGTFLGVTLWISIIAYAVRGFHLFETYNVSDKEEKEGK